MCVYYENLVNDPKAKEKQFKTKYPRSLFYYKEEIPLLMRQLPESSKLGKR
jgi:hypothetical protein